jgi:hypothetical protein
MEILMVTTSKYYVVMDLYVMGVEELGGVEPSVKYFVFMTSGNKL